MVNFALQSSLCQHESYKRKPNSRETAMDNEDVCKGFTLCLTNLIGLKQVLYTLSRDRLWLNWMAPISGGSSARSRYFSHAFDQPFDFFFSCVTRASGAQQSLIYFAEAFDHCLRVKIPVRGENAA
jgi:hypothetical protein